MINLAHDIAKKKFGKTFPNPTVGCVIAKNSKIISKAVTNKSGRPHAEEIALAKAGHKAKGASMYVTLEPCFHSSKDCLLYTSPSPRDRTRSRMPSSA